MAIDPTTSEGLVGNPAAAGGGSDQLTGNIAAGTFVGTGSSVASNADYVGGVNVANTSANILKDPKGFLGTEGTLSDNITTIDGSNPDNVLSNNDYSMDVDGLQGSAVNASTAQASGVTKPNQVATYNAATTGSQVDTLNKTTDAATAVFGSQSKVDVEKLDMDGLATGTNADGSTNEVGKAFNAVNTQNLSTIIDTTTVSGKLLAQNLGEGNYTDAKTQITFWMDTLSKDFVDPVTGQAKIPTWAAGALKGVNRMIAFKGVTGTAAISAVAAATMESIIPIASEESKFFQTMTVKNLDAKNTQALNTANILSKMNIADLDSRMTESITNAKNFIAYDMTNLSNEQQINVVEFQAKQQSIMEDAKQENVARQFGAGETNTMDKFYDELGSRIGMFNTEARNSMEKFNTGETNAMSKFNLTLENQREMFYTQFQKDVDESVVKWRQSVELTNNATLNNAAATDVKNIVGLTTEQLNQMWDRTDALLDYSFKESENQKNRRTQVQVAKMNYDAQIEAKRDRSSPFAKIAGAVIGGVVGSATGPIGAKIGTSIATSMFGE
jgi:AraC-like DNA-binding protein